VILDVMLPGIDGFASPIARAKAGNFVPILMLTRQRPARRRRARAWSGSRRLPPKPFDLPVLLARVKGLLRRRDWARWAPADGGDVETGAIGDRHVDFRTSRSVRRAGPPAHPAGGDAPASSSCRTRAARGTKAEILEKVWNVSADTADARGGQLHSSACAGTWSPTPGFARHMLTVRGAATGPSPNPRPFRRHAPEAGA
jgi:DNA-binding response OmpR family regulator